MDFKGWIKKQSVAFWLTLSTVVLAIVGLILYGVALGSGMGLSIANGSQPFYQADRDEDAVMIATVLPCGILAVVALIASVVLEQFSSKGGIAGKVMDIVGDVLRVAGPVLLFVVAINFVYGSFTGLGWTFFSNSELEIYPKAISTGKTVITGIVFFLIAAICSVVSTFFSLKKPDVKAE
ncbi:MAG: hypothetical protein PUA93_01060 [Eubacteriales bacterium]|nr:hypothetical protein [Eubacteriales bacterium]